MENNLQRLIELAKKTGDRLIIHDPVQGQDIVLLGIDAYEELVLGEKEFKGFKQGAEEPAEEVEEENWLELQPEQPAPPMQHRPPQEGDWVHTRDIFEERFKMQRPIQGDGGGRLEEELNFPLEGEEWGGREEALSDDEPVFLEEPV